MLPARPKRLLNIRVDGEDYKFDVQEMLTLTDDPHADYQRLLDDHAYTSAILAGVRAQRLQLKNLMPRVLARAYLDFRTSPVNFAAKFNPEVKKVTDNEAEKAALLDSDYVKLQSQQEEVDATFASLENLLRQLEMKMRVLEELGSNRRTIQRSTLTQGAG